MRFLKSFFLMVLASAFLVACGGGGGSDTGTGSAGSANLLAVYDKTTAGMTYEQVKALVGYAHNNGDTISGTSTAYKWSSGSGTGLELLQVSFENGGGARLKVYVNGSGVTRSQTF
jgi:hypothetical protein